MVWGEDSCPIFETSFPSVFLDLVEKARDEAGHAVTMIVSMGVVKMKDEEIGNTRNEIKTKIESEVENTEKGISWTN